MAEATLVLSPYAYAQDSIVLDARAYSIKNISGPYASMEDTADEKPKMLYRYDNKKLSIRLGKQFTPDDTFIIKITYVAHPEEQLSKGVITKKTAQGLFFINPESKDSLVPQELWSQGEPVDNSAWFPTIEANNQKFTQEVHLTVDNKFTTLSNGVLEYSTVNKDGTRTDFWFQNKPSAAYLAMIAVGNWKVIHDKWRDSMDVDYYVEPEYAPYARLVFGKTPEMIEFFSTVLGVDYPWQKFSQLVARDFVAGAMENTSAVIHFQGLQHDDRAHLDESYETTVSHELFHHWFGDLVTCKNWANLTLNESFATFGELIWEEHKYGKDQVLYHLNQNISAYLSESMFKMQPMVYYYYNDPDDMFDRHRYEKGGAILYMLKNYLGDEVFYNGLNLYLNNNAFKNATIENLRQSFEDASGKDLGWFFTQWYKKAGHPVLTIRQDYLAEQRKLRLIVRQKQASKREDAFKLPTALDIYTVNGIVRHNISIETLCDTFMFELPTEPLLVNFDPDKILLASKEESKSRQQWYYQYFNSKNCIDRSGAMTALYPSLKIMGVDSAARLLDAMLRDKFYNIRGHAVDRFLSVSTEDIKTRFKDIVYQIAQKDPVASVRSIAYSYIYSTDKEKAINMFQSGLSDSSYQVVSNCIRCLKSSMPAQDSAKLLAYCKGLEMTRSPEINFDLMDIYNRYPDATQLTFYHKALRYINTNNNPRYLRFYDEYLSHFDAATIRAEREYLIWLQVRVTDAISKYYYLKLLDDMVKKLQLEKEGAKSKVDPDSLNRLIDTFQKLHDKLKANKDE